MFAHVIQTNVNYLIFEYLPLHCFFSIFLRSRFHSASRLIKTFMYYKRFEFVH